MDADPNFRVLGPNECIDDDFAVTNSGPGWTVATWHPGGDGLLLTADTAEQLHATLGNLDSALIAAATQAGEMGPIVQHKVGGALVDVVGTRDANEIYRLSVHGTTVSVRRRTLPDGGTDTFVHVEDDTLPAGSMLRVQVNEDDETHHPVAPAPAFTRRQVGLRGARGVQIGHGSQQTNHF